jgi:hypothetical protein
MASPDARSDVSLPTARGDDRPNGNDPIRE